MILRQLALFACQVLTSPCLALLNPPWAVTWHECSRLITNCIVFYNMTLLSELWARKEATQDMTRIAHISPVAWQHINFYGRYDFTTAAEPINMEEIVEALAHHPHPLDGGRRRCLSAAECTVSGGYAKTPTFGWTTVAVCPTRANVASTSGPVVSNDCQRVVDFLNSPAGTAFAARQDKSKDQILQDAILPGSGANAQEVLFIMAFAAVMFGCINAAREIVKEAPIYRREHAVNLGIVPYLFSKIAVLGVLCLLQSAVLVVMVNVVAPLRPGIFLPANLEVYITLALTSLAGLMLGLMLSAVAPNNDRALSFLPLLLIPQVIFSGVIFSLNEPVMQFLGAFFPARWAMAALGSSVGLHGDKLDGDSFSYQGTLFVSVDPTKAQGSALAHLLLVWGALMIMIVLFGLLTGYFLKRKDVRV